MIGHKNSLLKLKKKKKREGKEFENISCLIGVDDFLFQSRVPVFSSLIKEQYLIS